MGLTVHALSERAVPSSLTIATKLVHVVSIIRTTVVWVILRIASSVSLLAVLLLLHMLSLRGRSMLSTQGWVWCVVSTVLRVVVSALGLLADVSIFLSQG